MLTCAALRVLQRAEDPDHTGVEVDERQAAGRERVSSHGLPGRHALSDRWTQVWRRGHVEDARHHHQQGAGQHQVEGLRREQDLVQVLRRPVRHILTQPLRRRHTLLTRRQLVPHVPRHGLRVGH